MATSTKLPPAVKARRAAPLVTPTDLEREGARDAAAALNRLLADSFALYLKTKNFHWHASGPHFRDYHLLFDEHGTQIFAMTDPIAERVRKLGGMTLRSIGQIAKLQRVEDNDAEYVDPEGMLAELAEDNKDLVTRMRETWDHGRDNATAVAHGLERTGRIITAAAIIMCAAFSGFVVGRIVGLQQFGLGLAVAIFVDATIVRSLLVPSLMAMLGRWNWWLPPRLARILRVEPSPLESPARP